MIIDQSRMGELRALRAENAHLRHRVAEMTSAPVRLDPRIDGTSMPIGQRLILGRLLHQAGEWVLPGALMAAAEIKVGQTVSWDTLRVRIHQIRKRLVVEGVPLRIENQYYVGYRAVWE